ncbi:penicillin-binding protein 4* [Antarctobacter heliothermus]|uniref:Penicillin-binding protein 4 n=1 Tax=Antarctobacter heliothermus TaxID=74033 RepID=A0A222E8X3_9RHOB|nr:serine hydrolase domain-containing protein [Antarctobacter heliothermus]ASP22616.1 penicillin-binding protein 4* [Antarctobacter heliothermus]
MLRALCLAVLWAMPLAAQSERVALEWGRWLAAEGNPPGALVFTLAGTELLAQESGASVDVPLPLPLASNSKAITALCAVALVDAGKMHWNDTVGDWIEGGGSVTLAELVTHTSGYWPDSTQGLMADWRGDTTRRWQEVTANVLDRPKQEGTRGTFRYNNENYAVLGLVIEEVADDWYDAACRARVLDPLGITTADLSPDYGGFGPWGGWQMSVRDYAHFMNGAYAGADPLSTPHADMGDSVSYGLGMVFRSGRGQANHWHFGALCFEDAGLGTFAVNWAGRYTIVAAYRACVDWEAMAALDNTLVRAVFAD